MSCLAGIEADRILISPLAFKHRLHIEDRAFAVLSQKEHLHGLLLVGGGAAAGASVASSTAIAGTFFAPTGLWAWLGLATATTPVGWVLAAALVTGGSFYALGKAASDKSGLAEVVPKHINTPLDVLALSLLELVGGIAVKVALVDGEFADTERRAILSILEEDWGYDPGFLRQAIARMEASADAVDVRDTAERLAEFVAKNPDCEPVPMKRDLLAMVEEIVAADGIVRNTEKQALLETIAAMDSGSRNLLSMSIKL